MTTTPSRVHHIDKSLHSIKAQSFPVAKVFLSLPRACRREKSAYSLPERITRDSHVAIIRTLTDSGAATRLITALAALSRHSASQFATHHDALVITMDDDVIYHPHTVAILVRHALSYPDAALGFSGYRLRGEPFTVSNFAFCRRADERGHTQAAAAAAAYNDNTDKSGASNSSLPSAIYYDPAPPFDPFAHYNPTDVYPLVSADVICQSRAALFHSRFFDPTLIDDYRTAPAAALDCDDEWIAAHLSKKNIPRKIILANTEIECGKLKLKNGRRSGAHAASMIAKQTTVLEHLVNVGAFPHYTNTQTVASATAPRTSSDAPQQPSEWSALNEPAPSSSLPTTSSTSVLNGDSHSDDDSDGEG